MVLQVRLHQKYNDEEIENKDDIKIVYEDLVINQDDIRAYYTADEERSHLKIYTKFGSTFIVENIPGLEDELMSSINSTNNDSELNY